MSDLEGEAKPILVPLILGQASTLSPADQQVVATWGFKTFLMLHLLDMRAWIPPAPYAWLRDRGRAPDSVRISIAKFGGRIHTGRYDITGHAPANRPAVRPQDISEYRFSFNIGLLVYAGLGNVDLKPSRGYVGSFRTKQAALARKRYVDGELAALRVPTLHVAAESTGATLRQAAARWQASRVDVSPGTAQTYRVALNRLLPRLGDVPLERLDAQTVADLVAELHGAGLRKQTIRKTVSVLAMVLDHAGIQPNPARDKLLVKMPREERRELHPPTAAHVEAVVRLLPTRYRLPTLVLDATGMRIGELEALTWGDVDEPRQRWRVSSAVAKTDARAGFRCRTCSSRP
jgi:hypothetical protein